MTEHFGNFSRAQQEQFASQTEVELVKIQAQLKTLRGVCSQETPL
jgi:capsule polysaccharide export protein KpsE/RkpR